ncbi:MAG: tRNA lysidine(34) synthetase TilS [Actinophytocola sp.]|nr:tRNA lysidine(34) synthetase TilS [Actinophytocola sp.]
MAAQGSRVGAGAASVPAPAQAVLRVRAAVRELLADAARGGLLDSGAIGVAVSGGADSLALAEAAAYTATQRGIDAHALVVDHGLQDGSAEVANQAAAAARALGVRSARVIPVEVSGGGGMEAAARRARYAVLAEALPDSLVLLGHTRDDQAETVLLGLGRGSGPRSVAGMRPLDPPWARPLLGVPREITVRACAELALSPWQDPHNADPRFTRARLRGEVLPLLEDVLQGGVAAALARTAAQLREDADALDELAAELLTRATCGDLSTYTPPELEVATLVEAPAALRRRAARRWLLDAGARNLTDAHLRAVDDLVGRWRGQGGVWLGGDLVVSRAHGKLRVCREGSARAEPSEE